MKKFFLPFMMLAIFLYACENPETTETETENTEAAVAESEDGFYGESFDVSNAISTAELAQKMETDSLVETTIQGTVAEVCKAEGCWLKMDMGTGETMMVKMKDHEFFVPMDIDGREVIIMGVAQKETTSVDDLKHYAEDAGKSKDEIAAITEPKTEVVFIASGVKLM